MTKYIWYVRDVKFSCKDPIFEVNKLFIILQENYNALELAN